MLVGDAGHLEPADIGPNASTPSVSDTTTAKAASSVDAAQGEAAPAAATAAAAAKEVPHHCEITDVIHADRLSFRWRPTRRRLRMSPQVELSRIQPLSPRRMQPFTDWRLG